MKEKEFYSSKISDTLEEYLRGYDPEVDDLDSFIEELEECLEELKKTDKILSYSIDEPMSDGDLIEVCWYEKIEDGKVICRNLTLTDDFDIEKEEHIFPFCDVTSTATSTKEDIKGILF